jgi:hypothetical protein
MVGRLLVLCGAVLLLVGLPGYAVATRVYAGRHAGVAREGDTIRLTAARGGRLLLGVHVDSVGSNWAAPDGLDLVFDDARLRARVVEPKGQDWGNSLSGHVSGQDVTGSFTVPDDFAGPERRTLSGTLTGRLVYPVASDGPCGMFTSGCFTDRDQVVNVPVAIQLVPRGDEQWSGGVLAFRGLALVDLALAAILVVAAAVAIVRARAARRRRPPAGEGIGCAVGGLLAVGAVLGLGLLGGLLLLGLGLVGGAAPDDVLPVNAAVVVAVLVVMGTGSAALLADPGPA